jgi:hypothetical protein
MTDTPLFQNATNTPPPAKPGPDSKYLALWDAVIDNGPQKIECETSAKADSRRMYLRRMAPATVEGESWDIVRRGRFVHVELVGDGDPS